MNVFLKWYLIGAVISLLIQIFIMITSPRVTLKMMIGYLLNTCLSWGCLLTFVCKTIVEQLEKHHKNITLWETKEYKELQRKMAKQNGHIKLKQ